jgi:hypothetical protein
MTQQIINTGSGPNAQDGDNLYVAFNKVNENFNSIWAQGPVDSNISIANNAIISTDVNGNIVLIPNGIGYAQLNATTIPGANNTYFLGDKTRRWRGIYAGSAGIDTTGNLYAGNLIISGNTSFDGDIEFAGNVTVDQNLHTIGNITTDSNVNIAGTLTSGPATFAGNVAITGNLQVAGNIVYIDVEELRVNDPVIELGTGINGAPLTSSDGFSRGVLMDYFNTAANTQQYGFMGLAGPNYTNYQFLTNATDVGNTFTGTPANVDLGNLYAAGQVSADGNIIGGNIVTVGDVSATANITGANLLTGGNISAEGGLIADTLYANTSIESGNTISAAGNITGAYLLGNGRFLSGIDTTLISNGTSRVQVVTADGNIIANVADATIATWTADGYSVTGNIDIDGYYTGNGRYLTGVVADSIGNVLASISVSGNANVGNLNTAGNVTGNYILGNGAFLTGIDTSLISNGTSNVHVATANGNITMSVDGTANVVEVSSTGAYVNGILSVTGNAAVGSILTDNYYYANGQPLDMQQPAGSNTWVQYNDNNNFGASDAFTFDSSANALAVSGNISGGNLRTTGQVSATGNIVGGNLRTTGAIVGGTGSFLSDVTIYGNLQVGGNIVYVDVSELRVADPVIELGGGPNGQPLTGDDGFSRGLKLDYFSDTANTQQFGFFGLAATDYTTYQFLTNATDTANTFTGTAANLYFGNASVTGNIATAGILTDGYYYANGAPVDWQQPAGSNTQIQINDNNNFGASANLTFDTDTQILYVGGQASITGNANVGNLNTTGNAVVGGIKTDNYYYANGAPVDFEQPAGSNTQIQFNDNNDFGASANLTFDNSTNVLSVNGNIVGGNLNTTGVVSANGNVYGGNISTAGNIDANVINVATANVGSITVGNVSLSGNITVEALTANLYVSANGNVIGGNLLTSGLVSATGNGTFGNLDTSGNVTANGVLTDNYYYANGAPVDWQQPAGSNTQIQFNDNNDFGASANLTFDSNTNLLTVGGGISATGNITAGPADFTGNVTIVGDLTVDGNVTYINVNDLRVEDPIIDLGGGPNGAPLTTNDGFSRGLKLEYFDTVSNAPQFGFMGLAASDYNTYQLLTDATETGNTFTGTAANLYLGNLSAIGNVATGGILTDNYYYANGQPLDMQQPAGSNTWIQFNDNNDFGASANLTFDSSTNQLSANGAGSFAGTVTGGNLLTGGRISATGNIDGGNLSGEFIIGTLSTNAQPNIISVGTLSSLNSGAISSSGNITGANILTGGIVSANGNVTGGNLLTSGLISAAGNINGNVIIGNTISSVGNAHIGGDLFVNGNVTYINIIDLNVQDPIISMGRGPNNTPLTVNDGYDRGEQLWYYTDQERSAFIGWDNSTNNLIAALDVTNNSEIITVNNWGNFVVGNLYTQALNSANILFVDTGSNVVTIGSNTVTSGATFAVNATDSMLVPVGNTFQRPADPVVGMIRFNTTLDTFEFYSDVDGWTVGGGTGSTSLTSQTFTADGSTTIFNLTNPSTTVDSMVQINGVTQVPVAAYSIVGTTLTFTEAPEAGDTIEVREIVAQSTVHAITNSSGNASISVNDASSSVTLQGILQLTPTLQPSSPQEGMVYFDSGTKKLRCYDGAVWQDLF